MTSTDRLSPESRYGNVVVVAAELIGPHGTPTTGFQVVSGGRQLDLEQQSLAAIQFRRAGRQGPTRTPIAALKRLIKQLLGTCS